MQKTMLHALSFVLAGLIMGLGGTFLGEAADPAVLKPRVPANQIEEARTWANPFHQLLKILKRANTFFMAKLFASPAMVETGKASGIFQGYVANYHETLRTKPGKPPERMGSCFGS